MKRLPLRYLMKRLPLRYLMKRLPLRYRQVNVSGVSWWMICAVTRAALTGELVNIHVRRRA